jgi:hypothetical protein
MRSQVPKLPSAAGAVPAIGFDAVNDSSRPLAGAHRNQRMAPYFEKLTFVFAVSRRSLAVQKHQTLSLKVQCSRIKSLARLFASAGLNGWPFLI